jgi:diamine N-acetyltransferase
MQEEKPIINIAGEKVALGSTHKGMIPFFEKWDNDFAISIMSGDPLRPVTREVIEADYERHSKEDQHQVVDFAIYEYTTMRLIGTTGLRHINSIHRNAEFSIYIGEKDCWGKGYGTEATILVLDYGFTILGLHNIVLRTYGYNERAIRAYTRAGFREMGRWREAARVGDRRYDIVYMDCLVSEFTNPLKRIIELPGTK